MFERVFEDASIRKDVVDLELEAGSDEAYAAATAEVVHQTLAFAAESHGVLQPIGILVWDGKPRAANRAADESARFSQLMRAAGARLVTVSTTE
jgi:hypothetical protein